MKAPIIVLTDEGYLLKENLKNTAKGYILKSFQSFIEYF